jgi:quinoprotein glucose dehydrogenase
VIALDPGTGAQKWRYDPKVSESERPGNRYVYPGVAYWVDEQADAGAVCGSRIFMGTKTIASLRSMRRPASLAAISATTVK